jgi:SAM-dependent methyltransferase
MSEELTRRSPKTPGAESIGFDRAADIYDATRGFPPGVAERVASLVEQAAGLGSQGSLLEIGVGTGRLALPLAARGVRVTGVDLSRRMMARLLAKRGDLPVEVVWADATLLPFPRGSFDAALAVHVFHLIPRWREVLGEIARVLPARGVLVHAGDDRTADWAQWRDALGRSHSVCNVGVPHAQIETFPEQQGWELVGDPHQLAFSRRLEPQRLVDGLLRRDWSWTWGLTDAQVAEAAESLRATFVRRFGGLDSSVEVPSGFWVRVYRPPPAARAAT